MFPNQKASQGLLDGLRDISDEPPVSSFLPQPVFRSIQAAPAHHAGFGQQESSSSSFWGEHTQQALSLSALTGEKGVRKPTEKALKGSTLSSSSPSSSLSSSNLSVRVSNLSLSPAPAWLEKYTSFYSCSSAVPLFSALDEVLQTDPRVDHRAGDEESKMEAVLQANGGATCVFHIRLYQASDRSETLVEVQRRQGCPVSFMHFYSGLLTALARGGHFARTFMPSTLNKTIHAAASTPASNPASASASASASATPASAFSFSFCAPALPCPSVESSLAVLSVTVEEDAEDEDILMDMVELSALSLPAPLAMRSSAHTATAASPAPTATATAASNSSDSSNTQAFTALMQMAASDLVDVQREALPVLAELSSEVSVCAALTRDPTHGVVHVLEHVLCSPDHMVLRAASTLLCNLFLCAASGALGVDALGDLGRQVTGSPSLLASVVAVLDSPACLLNAHTKRQLSKALESLSSEAGNAQALKRTPDALSTLQKYQASADSVLAANAKASLANCISAF